MNSVTKTFKYKLDLTPQQAAVLARTKGLCNWLYNTALEQRRAAWQMRRLSLSYYDQANELPELKAAVPEFKEVHSQVLQQVLVRLDRAYQAFYRRCANGEKPGFPRFQGANRYHSFTYPQYGNGASFDNGFLVLSKIGRIAVRWSRPLEGTPKTVTVSQAADGWYVTVVCVGIAMEPLPLTGHEIGIDVGVKEFLVTSDGEMVHNPRLMEQAQRKVRWLQKRVSRCQKGSHRRKKAITALAKAHQTVARQRLDFHHKTANALVQANDVICLEDLQVRNMVRNHHLARVISDAGWAQFRTILSVKAAWAWREVIAVPPQYTSQDCSGILPDGRLCLERVWKSLSVRTHVCPRCGLILDRDANAAINIKRAGLALRGAPATAGTVNRESPVL